MNVPRLLALGLCLSLTYPALAQGPGGQHQQQNRPKHQQQNRPQTRQQDRQQNRPQTRQQDRQQNRPQTREQTRQQSQAQARERFHVPNAPPRRTQRSTGPRYDQRANGRVDRSQHYRDGRWYGRPSPNDRRFRLSQPYAHGRFNYYGPRYVYGVARIDPYHRWFWLTGGFYFQVAAWDWPISMNWCWGCGPYYVVYLDPDHPGWYIIYNMQTGTYVHAIYMGT